VRPAQHVLFVYEHRTVKPLLAKLPVTLLGMSPGFEEPPRRTIDLMRVPREPWYRIAYLFSRGAEAATANAADWVEQEFGGRDRLRSALEFAGWHLADGARGDVDALDRVWFFPWTESALELHLAFACSLAGLHRAAVDHHRRALELVVVGAYFVAEHVDATQGAKWYASDLDTPHFTRALDKLAKTGFCEKVDDRTGWRTLIKGHYRRLSDISHVRGAANSHHQLTGSLFLYSGFPMPSFSPSALEQGLNLFLETCSHVAAALAVANPALLVGMPLSEKYGENPPIGFFEDAQAKALSAMLPDAVREGFAFEAAKDDRIPIRRHMESMPDISEEEVRRQIEGWQAL
jgi:hypothetical protein